MILPIPKVYVSQLISLLNNNVIYSLNISYMFDCVSDHIHVCSFQLMVGSYNWFFSKLHVLFWFVCVLNNFLDGGIGFSFLHIVKLIKLSISRYKYIYIYILSYISIWLWKHSLNISLQSHKMFLHNS